MTQKRVAVLDYGSGNLRSVVRAVERAGAEVTLTSDAKVAESADGLVVPGVGAFAECMKGLKAIGGDRIIDRRLMGSRPVLGICVGMQILFAEGIEHGVDPPRTASAGGTPSRGLGQWPGVVEALQATIVPHMGWNTVTVPENSRMFAGIEDERFYFVHSYGVRKWTLQTEPPFPKPAVTWTDYDGDRFVAAAENGPLWATQFHPEKSGDAGAQLLRNWLAVL